MDTFNFLAFESVGHYHVVGLEVVGEFLEVSHIQKCGSLPCGWFGGHKGIPSRIVLLLQDAQYFHMGVKWLHKSR